MPQVGEADKFADEDKKRREAVDTKNQAESMLYQTEKQLKEFEAKVPEDVKSKLQAKMEELRTAVNADDVEGMKKGMETLQQEAMAMGQAMYSQAGAAGSPPPPGADAGAGSKPNDDNVIDAEVSFGRLTEYELQMFSRALDVQCAHSIHECKQSQQTWSSSCCTSPVPCHT